MSVPSEDHTDIAKKSVMSVPSGDPTGNAKERV